MQMSQEQEQTLRLTDEEVDEYCERFVNKIKEKREKKQLTTYTLSSMTGISQGNITRMETLKTKPNLKLLVRICHALNVELNLTEIPEKKEK